MRAYPSLALVVNAGAGRVRSGIVERVATVLRTRFTVTIHTVTDPLEVTRCAREAAQGAELVVAFGGDGTASRVAAGVAGTAARFSVLPGGSTNHVARLLGFPNDPLKAAHLLVGPVRFRRLDLGRIDAERVLLFLGGVGIDALIMRDATPQAKRFFAWRSYLLPGLRHLFDGPWTYEIAVDGERREVRARTVLVANGGFLVNPHFRLGPMIDPADGVLDIVWLCPPHWLGWIELFAWVALGRLWRSRFAHSLRGRRILVRAKDMTAVEIDGDYEPARSELAVTVEPGALTAVVPAFSRGIGE